MTGRSTCQGHHAHRGQVLGCELEVGHPLPHARESGTASNRGVVSWRHESGRRAAEAEALRWRRDHGAWAPAADSAAVTLARLAAAVAAVVGLVVLVGGHGA